MTSLYTDGQSGDIARAITGRAPDFLSQNLQVDKLIKTEMHDIKKT